MCRSGNAVIITELFYLGILFSGGSRISGRGRRPRGGRQLPRRLRFEKFVCQNERIWTLRGAHAGGAPQIRQCYSSSVADPGGVPPARTPLRVQILFDIQNFRNVAASGVGAPPTRLAPPLREILDPPLILVSKHFKFCKTI